MVSLINFFPVIITCLLIVFSVPISAEELTFNWQGSNLSKCMEITIINSGNSNLTNFPAYINIKYDEDMLSDYKDLRFVSNNCGNEGILLDYEIDDYNTENLGAWVRIPSLTFPETTISVYYKNNTVVNSGENSTGVWDERYKAVWHMNDLTSGSIGDSTFNNNHGIKKGANEPIESNCKINKCQNFDGVDDEIKIGSIGGDYNFTIEAWVEPDDIKQRHNIIQTCNGHLEQNPGGWYYLSWNNRGGSGQINSKEHYGNVTQNIMQYVVITAGGISKLNLYVNGILVDNTFISEIATHIYTENRIGSLKNIEGYTYRFFDGTIDEIRISNTLRSADWIKQTYNMIENQNNYVIFSEEKNFQYKPIPKPTLDSLIISSEDWKNVLSAIPVSIPLIISNGLKSGVEKFIEDYNPDYIYTLGFSLGLNNSYEIGYDQIPELFFPNATQAIYIENQTQGIFASNLAYYLGLPLIFDIDSEYEIIDLSNKTVQHIQNLYLNEIVGDGKQIDYLVLTNLESSTSLFTGRIAGLRRGFIVPVNISDIQYFENVTKTNENNRIWDIKETLNTTIGNLANIGLYSDSVSYKRENTLYLAILGDEYDLPFMFFWDPGNERINDKDGCRIYNDIWYGDVNSDLFLDLATGRFYGNMTAISLQLERTDMEKNNNATIIGLYRHRKYEDVYHLEGGMAQAWNAERLLDIGGMKTRRIVEKRIGFSDDIDEFVKQVVEIGIKEFILSVLKTVGESSESAIAGSIGAITIIWPLADASSMVNYAFYEYDWENWIEDMYSGNVKVPEHLEIFGLDTDLENPNILGYFGLGDDYWTIPPEDRSELELILDPYGGSDDFKELNFSNFLYDDHDLSANSSIAKQVLSEGGMVFGSSGIIHDIYTIYTSNEFFRNIIRGRSIGESFRQSTNINVMNDFKKVFYLLLKGIIPLPDLYMKEKLERVLLADPKYTPIEKGVRIEEPEWIIEPYHSYSSKISIISDYYLENRKVYVENADSSLIEQGKPIIPVFIREFILPEGSEIKYVDLKTYYRKYNNIKPQFVHWDEYYNETPYEFNGDYPDKKYWYKINDLLDGRTLVRIYVLGLLYKNKKAKVLKFGRVKIDYESPVELIVKADDAKIGNDVNIKIDVLNEKQDSVKGSLWVWVEKEGFYKKFNRTVIVGPESSKKEYFHLELNETGKYKITTVFDSDSSAGPRHNYFNVLEKGKHKRCKWFCWVLKFLKKHKKWIGLFD